VRTGSVFTLVCALGFSVAAAGEVQESFDATPPGSLPSGWQPWLSGEGKPHWAVEQDGAAPSGGQVLRQTGWTPNPSFPVLVNTNIALRDGFVEVKFRPESGTNDQAAGVVWRFKDSQNYYVARANARENNVVLYKVQDGKRTSLDIRGRKGGYGVAAAVPARRWSTLRVDFSGSVFRVRLNGEHLFSVEDGTFQEPGSTGLWTKADSVTSFDDFRSGTAEVTVTHAPLSAPRYETRAHHDPDGIGKFYMGREIAQVMGHQAADWLERPLREGEEQTGSVLPALKLKAGDTVADVGAGTGYYTRRLARAVNTNGLVYAVDIQPEMLVILTNKLAAENIHNVRPVLGKTTDPRLPPDAVDLILMVDVYHEFDHPFEMVEAMCKALKRGGRLVFMEFRAEDPAVPIKRVHKMSEAQVRKEMSAHPVEWVETIRTLPQQHIIVFRKR
jgi:SAM-dependent methyltransferase